MTEWAGDHGRPAVCRSIAPVWVVVVRVLLLVSVLSLASVAIARSGDDVLRLNSDDPLLIELVGRGLRGSETFRDLYRRLEQADVVVHLRRGSGGLVAAGYNQFVTTVNVDRTAFDGQLQWLYSGAQIFLTGSF